ncbi:MAG: Ig-like domain-containing protein [Bacteroidota bacterium]
MSMKHTFLFALISVLLTSCAIQVPPQGGERDVDPPKLIRVSPPSGSVDFSGHSFEFEFDENIQVKDLSSKLVVSPPLSTTPTAKVRKNKLVLEFDDTLRPASTYCFNFGDALADLNEGNVLKDFRQVVSTGSFIDSLTISGSVSHAEDLKPEKSMLVMLYPELSGDSAPYNGLPLYFSRTRENGDFTITNIAAGSYRMFGLLESNQDYRYSDPAERIAFLEHTVASADSGIKLYSFNKLPPAALVKSSAAGPGKILFVFNRIFPSVNLRWKEQAEVLGIPFVWRSANEDSLIVWYTRVESDTAQFLIDFPDRTDTVDLTLRRLDPEKKSSTFLLDIQLATESPKGVSPIDPLIFLSNYPIASVDRGRLSLTLDSVEIASSEALAGDSDRLVFKLPVAWQEEKNYSLTLLPGAFTDIFGHANTDTLEAKLPVRSVTDYGTLKIDFHSSSAGGKIIQLVDEKERVYRSAFATTDSIIGFAFIQPGTYRLKCIFDENGNGRWDAGDDLSHRLPEKVRYYRDMVPIRANWDVEVKWELPVK